MSATSVASNTFSNVLQDNKSMMAKIEDYRSQPITAKKRNLLFAGLAGGTVLFSIMFAVQIISGMFALLFSGVVLAGGYYGIRTLKTLDPAIQQKLKNANLKMMIDEAKRNAVTQLDRQVLENTERLKNGQRARDEIGGTIRKMKAQISTEDQNSDFYKRQMDLINRVKSAYDQICDFLVKAKEANQQFERKVYEYKQLDKLSNMANAALSTFNDASGISINEMLSLEAFEAIDDSFHTSLTALENRASDLNMEA